MSITNDVDPCIHPHSTFRGIGTDRAEIDSPSFHSPRVWTVTIGCHLRPQLKSAESHLDCSHHSLNTASGHFLDLHNRPCNLKDHRTPHHSCTYIHAYMMIRTIQSSPLGTSKSSLTFRWYLGTIWFVWFIISINPPFQTCITTTPLIQEVLSLPTQARLVFSYWFEGATLDRCEKAIWTGGFARGGDILRAIDDCNGAFCEGKRGGWSRGGGVDVTDGRECDGRSEGEVQMEK